MKPPENLAVLMAEKTNGQLQEMFQRPDDWLPETLKVAKGELKKRGVEPIEIPQVKVVVGQSQPRRPRRKRPCILAVASLVLACSSIVTPLMIGPVGGIVFGHLALWRIRKNIDLGGGTMAMWGLGIGYAFFAIIIFLGILFNAMFRGFR